MLHQLLDRLPLGWRVKLAILRLASQWRSLLTVIIGVVLAATIGANVPLYTAAVSQIGMVERLEQQPPENIHVFTRISYSPVQFTEEWQQFDALVRLLAETTLAQPLPGWLQQTVAGVESLPMRGQHAEAEIPAARFRLAYYDGWHEAVEVISGELPETPTDPAIDLEVALSIQMANEFNLAVSDQIVLEDYDTPTSQPIRVRISAIVREADPTAAYWVAPSPLRFEPNNDALASNVLINAADMERMMTDYLPQTRTQMAWRLLFDYSRLAFDDVPLAIAQLEHFEKILQDQIEASRAERLNFVYTNTTPDLLRDYQAEVRLLAAPFGLLLLQIGALVLFFLLVIVALVRRGERREIALLQSRGAQDRQILWVRGLEAFIICLAAVLIAPWIAQRILMLLAPALMQVERLPLKIGWEAFAYAGIGGFAALLMLIVTLFPVLHLPLISAGGSALRSDSQLWWQRYYLDVLLMIIGLLSLWRLLNANSAVTETTSGETRADPLLLLTPALLFVALGSVLLRLFPTLMQGIAGLMTAQRGLGGALASWQVSREPMHYARITFLLALSIGTGWFATSFQATVIRSQSDQARYQLGADVQVRERERGSNMPRLRDLSLYGSVEGVNAVAPVLRYENSPISTDELRLDKGDLLAVDYETLAPAIYWREDLGVLPNPLPDPLELPQPGGELPFIPQKFGFWAKMEVGIIDPATQEPAYHNDIQGFINEVSVTARLRDEAGSFFQVRLVGVEVEGLPGMTASDLIVNNSNFSEIIPLFAETTGWVYFEADLSAIEAVGSLRLDALAVYNSDEFFRAGFNTRPLDWRLFITDVTVTDAAGTAAPLDWFVSDNWFAVADRGREVVGSAQVETAPDRNVPAIRLQWGREGDRNSVGMVYNYPPLPSLPVLVSESFLALNNLNVGLTFQLPVEQHARTFEIIGTTEYYPTLYAANRPFLITDLDSLLYVLNRHPSRSVYPSEAWIRLAPDADPNEFLQDLDLQDTSTTITQAATFEQALNTFETDPLSLGLIGLLYLSFLIVLVLSVISLITYAALTAQARRAEFGVLQALGLSSQRLVASLALEQGLVMVLAAGMGVILGVILSNQVLPTLASSTTTRTVTPPFVVQVETNALLQYGALMLVILGLVLLISLLLVRQLSVAQVIKLGEE